MNLKKISLILSLLGIYALLLISTTIEPKLIKINEIDQKNINQKIKVIGKVESIKVYDQIKVIDLKDSTGSINVILPSEINIEDIKKIEVIGRITKYKQELQLTADKITQIL